MSLNPEGAPITAGPQEISQLEGEIRERWECLPIEDQTRILADLLGMLPEGDGHTWPETPQGEPLASLRKERGIHPRYSESYDDGELRIDVITDETIPQVNIGIKPGAGAGLLAFFKEKIVTEELVYACVEGGGSIFPRPVKIDWSQPVELAWKRKEGAMGMIFRARIPPEKIDSLTFLQRQDGGLRVIYYWPQMFFDEGIERMESLPAAEIAALEFFFSRPEYMVGREGFPNGVLVQWAREQGGDPRVRSVEPEMAVTVFNEAGISMCG